nr:hypothetical protein [Tanacetum cinerariifolium]
NYLTQAYILASQSRENVNAAMAGSGQNIQEQSLRMIRDKDEEEEDERSDSVNALNNKGQQLGLCGIQNIAIQRHPPKEGAVPSDIDIIQESVAMVTTPADVIRLPQHTTYGV